MFEVFTVREGFSVLKLTNQNNEAIHVEHAISNEFIQMHFCVQGDALLHYGPHYTLPVKSETSLLLYNPNQALPINLKASPKTRYVVFVVKIQLFHSFFSQVASIIPFLNEENSHQKYYLDKALSPEELLVLNQLIEDGSQNNMHDLYLKAKVYELLSIYFGKTQESKSACPFLDSEDNVEKIKLAKQLVIEQMAEPPSLQELADEIGLSLAKLKEGFKHIYGESVFNFLLDYKLEYARKQLLSKQYNVSEISLQVGYSTASHFISAFKKKYGTTPKQYILSVN